MITSLKGIVVVFLLCATVSSAWKYYGPWRENRTSISRPSDSYYPVFGRPQQKPYVESDENSNEEDISPLSRWNKRFGQADVCDKCPPGYGLVTMCNATHRTVCQPCTLGINYSAREPHFKPCAPCSKCGSDMYEDISCTTVSDTFCDSCTTKRGFHNEDYVIKCKTRDENDVERLDVDAENNLERLLKSFNMKEIDSNELEDALFNDKDDDFDVNDELSKVYGEIKKELDQVSKEIDKPDDMDEEFSKLSDEVEKEQDEEDKLYNLNVTGFENAIDNSIKVVEVESFPLDKNLDEDNDDDDDDDDNRFITFTNRPDLDPSDDVLAPFNDDVDGNVPEFMPNKKDIVYKPSEHGYPYEDLLHPDYRYKQIRKVVWLYGITAIMLMMALMFLTCYAGSYMRRRRAYRMISAVHLTDQDNQIIRECAERLEQSQKPASNKRRNPFIHSRDDGVNIRENPLEDYLDDQPFNGSTESLIPNVHKGKKSDLQIV